MKKFENHSDDDQPKPKCDTTQFFFQLTPDRVLAAVERSGVRCTGRCLSLNSMENRVYEVEVEVDDPSTLRTPSDRFRVVKFYRPGRWTEQQILEEHQFLLELLEQEIPVIAPLRFEEGKTLYQEQSTGIAYAIFPKVGGRAPDEFTDEQLEQVGRLLARIHNVGSVHPAHHRLHLNPVTYGIQNLEFLLKHSFIPEEVASKYESLVRSICTHVAPWFESVAKQRIHGDCHLGNLLWNSKGPFFLDFDDMVMGPCVQDLWLVVPGRDESVFRQREVLVSAYEQMRSFDRSSLRLIEPLRALRFVHFSAWIAKRWEDPAFPLGFPQFGTPQYWEGQAQDLREQLGIILGT